MMSFSGGTRETPTAPEALADGLRSRLMWALFLRSAASYVAGWCFAWGVAALALRMLLNTRTAWVLWGAVGLGGALLAAAWRARKQLPSRRAALAMVDGIGRAGGLVMASGEAELGDWRPRVPSVTLPTVHWPARKGAILLSASAALVLAACVIPQRYLAPPGAPRLDVAGQVERLADQVDLLAKEELIRPDEAERIRRELEQIADQARGDDPARTLEALDHLENKLAATTAEALQKAIQSATQTAAARAMAESLAADAGRLEPNALAEGMKHLAQQLDRAKEASEQLSRELAGSANPDANGVPGGLDANQLQQLSQQLGQCNAETIERLRQLAEAGLLDAEALQRALEAGQAAIDPESLAEMLEGMQGGESIEDLAAEWARLCRAACEGGDGDAGGEADGLPGRGGVSRGRGDAGLTWKDQSSKEGVDFREQVIPPGRVADLKRSRLLGLSAGAPEAGDGGDSGSGALGGAESGGGSTHRRTILPRHRQAVREYFDRPAPAPKKESNP